MGRALLTSFELKVVKPVEILLRFQRFSEIDKLALDRWTTCSKSCGLGWQARLPKNPVVAVNPEKWEPKQLVQLMRLLFESRSMDKHG